MKSPGRIICHGCDGDLGTSGYDEDTGAWLYPCPDCVGVDGPLTLEVRYRRRGRGGLRGGGGIMADLGVYDGVKEASLRTRASGSRSRSSSTSTRRSTAMRTESWWSATDTSRWSPSRTRPPG
jgi:hypothetical protein